MSPGFSFERSKLQAMETKSVFAVVSGVQLKCPLTFSATEISSESFMLFRLEDKAVLFNGAG